MNNNAVGLGSKKTIARKTATKGRRAAWACAVADCGVIILASSEAVLAEPVVVGHYMRRHADVATRAAWVKENLERG